MPVVAVTPTSITRPEELVEFLADYLGKSDEFDFQYIAKYDEKLIPAYPALHVQAAPFGKALHATHTFAIEMRAAIHVLHANFREDRRTRSYEDLRLATKVVDYLESDMTIGGHIIQGWVESEIPGVMPPRVTKGEAVLSTRLNWTGLNLRRF